MTAQGETKSPHPLSLLHRRWTRRLRTVSGVRGEMMRLYGEAREGLVDPRDATRLAHLLNSLARLIEGAEFEGRMAAIEATLEQQAVEADRHRCRPNGHSHPPP